MKMSWLFRHPTPMEIAEHQRETARRDWLQHAALQEFHAAMAKMLEARIVRLDHELGKSRGE